MKLQSNGLPEGMIIVEAPDGVIDQEHLDAIQRQLRESSDYFLKSVDEYEETSDRFNDSVYKLKPGPFYKESEVIEKVEAIKADRDWAITEGFLDDRHLPKITYKEFKAYGDRETEVTDLSFKEFVSGLSVKHSRTEVPGTFFTPDDEYLMVADDILHRGKFKGDRTGTGTLSLFGTQMRFDLSQGFPLLTTKKIHWKSVVEELLFFIRGGKYSEELEAKGVKIWKEWPGDKEKGTYIPYGKMWRDFGGVDQLSLVIKELKNNPDSRRLVISTWNPPERDNFVLDPCHVLFQFYVEPLREGETKRRLSCQLYQRK